MFLQSLSAGKISFSVVLLLSLSLVWACEPAEQKTRKTEKPEEEKKQAQENNILLTDNNVAQVLGKYAETHKENRLLIHTPKGTIKIRLYEDTPLHRANFLRLVEKKYFDQTVFYRVMPKFMIQAGRSDVPNKVRIGQYTLPAEILPHHFHKKGAVAMARNEDKENPERRSSAHDFYIVTGDVFDEANLNAVGREYGIGFGSEQKAAYFGRGGAPHLDGAYTVFGEVTQGLEIIDQIAGVKTDKGFWPLEEISIRAEIIK